ncbi:regulator of hemoglobinization and erythroid cell expansion protein [Coturnix japonica]|uniref:regulator of hemoglobinization and erythroid cell expansion protein n=1 Tax=Coturnix japonica TaxID=93934 RepID=UPI000778053C|nr:regulator of hemoglobinization and erythroid cell expansion protein [Coturnix japonica]XP_032305167.1 regulator of hemoglobinization and erythroid cell expansion protein [Coturnix japonica]XP_032305168.1 regulator of hemoglobinization and erythroid cell expansion protein [Coturnix japonica]XP_032305169.1 regulator of hemoglobinization and erythroid cell expansion protein [Coturnix japonica]
MDVAGTALTAEMEHCEWWVPVASSAVSLLLCALLLLVLYIMLSRKIDRHSCSAQVSSCPAAAQPQQMLRSSAGGEGMQQPECTGSSETSSETSEDSDSSSLHPQERKTSKDDLNYTSVLFSGKGHRSGSYRNYENMKVGADYVNVDPKKKKADFWACSSPVASKPIEYTEVKL